MRTTYKVLERLGGGGQAEVFRGVAETLQGFKKAVAIKRVPQPRRLAVPRGCGRVSASEERP